MNFESYSARDPHGQHIECIFHYDSFFPDHSIERVVPTGHAFLIFELDGKERMTYDNDSLQVNARFEGGWLSATRHEYLSISALDGSEMFVIQFKPWGARPFLHQDMHVLANRVVPESELPALDLKKIRSALISAPNTAEKFSLADDWLAQRFDPDQAAPPPVMRLTEALDATPASQLNDLLKDIDGSHKHIIDLFKKYVGVTPKQYQRIRRFNDIFVQMQNDQFLSWSDIAYRCGYSDQSHFIREFKRFSGFNPEAFLRADHDTETANFFPLDREG